MKKQLGILLLLLLTTACVDRIFFDPPLPEAFAVVIEGSITDEPGPYEVRITRAFDIQSKSSIKQSVIVKSVVLSDDIGHSEQLVAVQDGVYQTTGVIQGTVGRSYSIRVTMLDGRVYESTPDPLLPGGTLDNVYKEFVVKDNDGARSYGFNISFDATSGGQSSFQFLWRFVGTYKVDTTPDLHTQPCGESQCPNPLPCSAARLGIDGRLEYVKPCECCSCWVEIRNETPIVSDDQLVLNGKFQNVPATQIPLTAWIFQNKIHAEIQQLSLSPQAFAFWKAIKAQKEATTSLFQPLTGRIIGNFHQVSGLTGPAEGIFYASSVRKKSIYISSRDVPNPGLVPVISLPFNDTCLKFANSTTIQPDYWQ